MHKHTRIITMVNNNKQAELFKAETTWFHVFKDMIESGDVAKMGAYAVTVYLVIKSYTNFSTGRAFPAIDLISEKSGISEAQVKRVLKTLEENGYITKIKTGRHNTYTLREKVSITDEVGRPQAVATWDYLPTSVKDAVADLKNVLVSGDFNGARLVNIEHLTVNVFTGAQAQQVNLTTEALAKLPANLRDTMEALRPNGGGG